MASSHCGDFHPLKLVHKFARTAAPAAAAAVDEQHEWQIWWARASVPYYYLFAIISPINSVFIYSRAVRWKSAAAHLPQCGDWVCVEAEMRAEFSQHSKV